MKNLSKEDVLIRFFADHTDEYNTEDLVRLLLSYLALNGYYIVKTINIWDVNINDTP